jgi:hypothetical protein
MTRPGRLRLAAPGGRRRAGRGLDCTNSYGLNSNELRREIRRLSALGWQTWEIARRFGCHQ